MDEKTALTYAITRALAYQENGGKLDLNNLKAGKSGELKSIFQFTPDTWKKDAGDILGDPNAPINPDNETKVVTEKVGKWIDQGYTAKQIASMWNAGVGEPNAYSGKFSNGKSSVGTNKYGANFNVPNYADNVVNYAKKFYKAGSQSNTNNQKVVQQTPNTPPVAMIQPTPQPSNPLASAISKVGGLLSLNPQNA